MTEKETRESRNDWVIEPCPECRRSVFYLKKNRRTGEILVCCETCQRALLLQSS